MSVQRKESMVPVMDVVSGRWSPRAFDHQQHVEKHKILACLEAARWSASCFGDEPWRFIVAERQANPETWDAMLGILAEGNQVWAKHAPVLILACAAINFSHNDKPNRWAAYDAGQAMSALSLQAVSEGLVTHSMGGFDMDAARIAFEIPVGFIPMSVTALGYLGEASLLPDHYRVIETSLRERKPLQELAFTSWGKAWEHDNEQ